MEEHPRNDCMPENCVTPVDARSTMPEFAAALPSVSLTVVSDVQPANADAGIAVMFVPRATVVIFFALASAYA